MNSRRVYCAYFDSAYLARGLAMLRSLRTHDPTGRIFVVALDDLTARVLQARFGPRIRVIGTAPLLTPPSLASATPAIDAVPGLTTPRRNP